MNEAVKLRVGNQRSSSLTQANRYGFQASPRKTGGNQPAATYTFRPGILQNAGPISEAFCAMFNMFTPRNQRRH